MSKPRLSLHRLEAASPERVARLGDLLLSRLDAGVQPEPQLVVASLTGQALLLGRHQRESSALDLPAVAATKLAPGRRLGGGRTLHCGEGTLVVLLVLPTAATFLSERAGADKVQNRHCRGLLRALTRLAGRPVAYFGRDFLSAMGTGGSRKVATLSQDGGPGGAVLLEAHIAVSRSLELPAGLSGYPLHHDPRSAGPSPATLVELSGREPSFDGLVEAIAAGYEATHGCEVVPAAAPPEGASPVEPGAREAEVDFDESGVADIAIGFAEALVRHDGGRVIEARLRGDFVAPTFVVRALEASLAGCPLRFAEVGSRVNAAFALPHSMSAGITDLRVLADAVLAAAGQPGAA